MISHKWTSSVLGLVIAGVILYLVRRDYLHSRYALWWMLTAGSALLLGLFPDLVDFIGATLGVRYPPILFVVVCLGLILIKILTMDLESSRHAQEIRRLTQRLALLEATKDSPSDKP